MGTILHISDLHFGRPFRAALGEAVLALEKEIVPQLTVCSGDIVQWAESDLSWTNARKFFDKMQQPTLVIPGNHDVPRAFFWQRFTDLYSRYTNALNRPPNPVFANDEMMVVGLASATPWNIDLGSLSQSQLDWMHDQFNNAPSSALKIVVQHQAPKAFEPRPWFRGHLWHSRRALAKFQRAGVDMILSGHNHFSHIERIQSTDSPPILWTQCGTSTSRRLRKEPSSFNCCHVISFSNTAIEITVYRYNPETECFESNEPCVFSRPPL